MKQNLYLCMIQLITALFSQTHHLYKRWDIMTLNGFILTYLFVSFNSKFLLFSFSFKDVVLVCYLVNTPMVGKKYDFALNYFHHNETFT